MSGIGPAVWVYLDGDGRLSAHAFATEAVCRDAAIGDYLTLQPVELPGWERPEFFWRPEDGNDGTFDLLADGYPTCYTVQRLPVLGGPKASAPRESQDGAPLEWGHRFVDGTGGPDDSRDAALTLVARFVPGFVEIVHRAGPDQPWVRAGNQPHVPSERLDQMAAHLEHTRRSNDWRGLRLAELGEYPNPPKDWHPIAAPESLLETARRWRTLGPHPAPGQDTPTHPGPGETCTEAVCVKSRAQHEAAGRIQDLTAELFPDDARGGAR